MFTRPRVDRKPQPEEDFNMQYYVIEAKGVGTDPCFADTIQISTLPAAKQQAYGSSVRSHGSYARNRATVRLDQRKAKAGPRTGARREKDRLTIH